MKTLRTILKILLYTLKQLALWIAAILLVFGLSVALIYVGAKVQ